MAPDTTPVSRAGFPLSWPWRRGPESYCPYCWLLGCGTWDNNQRIGSCCHTCRLWEHMVLAPCRAEGLAPELLAGPVMYFVWPSGKWKCWSPKCSANWKFPLFKIIKNQDSNNRALTRVRPSKLGALCDCSGHSAWSPSHPQMLVGEPCWPANPHLQNGCIIAIALPHLSRDQVQVCENV